MNDEEIQLLFGEFLSKQIDKEERRSGYSLEDWIITGRASREWPTKENIDWWTTKGPEFVRNFLEWRKKHKWPVWVTPDGRKAIELEFEVPWLEGRTLRGYIDLVLVNPKTRKLVVVDAKAGSRDQTDRQLARYACAIEIEYGIRPTHGMYLMVRKDPDRQRMIPLNLPRHSKEYLMEEDRQIRRGIDNQIFFTKPDNMCGTCTVKEYCPEFQGE